MQRRKASVALRQAEQRPTVLLQGRPSGLSIEYRPIDKLWQSEKAPRRFSRADSKKVTDILRRFGIRLPLVIRKDGQVLSHFVVVSAARQLGYDELPVVLADDLSDIECDQLSLALSRIYELGKFDQQLLGEMLIDIQTTVPDISFDTIGFDMGEVDQAIGSIGDEAPDEDEAPQAAATQAVSTRGDIWQCGPHRVGCGDAADADWLSLLLPAPAAMVSADPPYGCPVGGFVTSRDHREFVQGSGEMSEAELEAAFTAWCKAMLASAKPGALVYLYIDWRSCELLMRAAGRVFGALVNMAVWVKDRAGMGSFYRSQHELVLIYAVPGAQHRNNVQLGRHGRNRSNVWRYASAATFGKSSTEGDLLADHPTPKNKEMLADSMLDATRRGEVVLDPFLGSGSTLIAAEKAGRVCCGSDLDPLYVDLAVRRWEAWTGQDAVHAGTGHTFRSIEQDVLANKGGRS